MVRARWTARLLNLGLGLLTLLCFAACQPGTRRIVDFPADVRFAADSDSLGLAAHLALPASVRDARTREADIWRRRVVLAEDITVELQALRTVVGLDPTDAASWLQLARRTRWFGDYIQTEDALTACREAVRHLATGRHEVAGRAAVCESWLRYDRGDWKRGRAWADSASAHGADDDEVQLLRALHLAGLGRNRKAEDIAYRFADRDHRAHWIYGVSFWRRGGPQPGHGIFTGTAGSVSSGATDFVQGEMRPTTVRAAECYRDFGAVEEQLGNWWNAEQKYEFSAGFVPDLDRASVARVAHPPLGRSPGDAAMPVWLSYDRYYVTGSLSAYTALAHARYEAALSPGEREFWGASVLDAVGTLVRLDIDIAWARRARGLVLADYVGKQGQARVDLEAALRWFDRHSVDDLRTMTTLAHLYLEADRPARARPILERASQLAPEDAQVWSDLGLSYIELGEVEPALAALRRALDLDEDLAVAWYNRGLLRYHLEDLPGAVSDLERAHELAPENAEIMGLLKQLRKRLGKPDAPSS